MQCASMSFLFQVNCFGRIAWRTLPKDACSFNTWDWRVFRQKHRSDHKKATNNGCPGLALGGTHRPPSGSRDSQRR
ncbi:hypothetical protein RMSM_06771 [Rhodopirellula maiorica SM1]|uniref:Uncharacterized protein n=1 Tax=Rhodopirellula maiorica SM1 TaxID=1265738 RepID=M5RLQ3_9BACT|nr:hypothetical protein RMSM_06771 [Rhodopirellula maiorica SM1]